MRLSQKPIKECSSEHRYIFSKHLANDVDPVTKKHCIVLSVNNYRRMILVDEPVDISEMEWKFLNSIGGYLPSNMEYDPIRNP
jgi:hypothetical protein